MIKSISRNVVRQRRHARVRKNISGTPERPRLNVFRSNKNIEVQVIDDVNGVTLASASSLVLKLTHGGNIEAAKEVGKAIAEVCKEKNIEKVVFDRGGYLFHGRVKALAESARANGLQF